MSKLIATSHKLENELPDKKYKVSNRLPPWRVVCLLLGGTQHSDTLVYGSSSVLMAGAGGVASVAIVALGEYCSIAP